MGFRFNGVTSQSLGLNVISYKKPLLPPLTVSQYAVPLKAGTILNQYKMEPRQIVIDCMFMTLDWTTYESKVRQLASWLYTSGVPKQLILDEESDRYYNVVLSDTTDLEESLYKGKVSLQFIALDPFAYAVAQDTVTWSSGASVIINNGGPAPVYPVINWKVYSGGGAPYFINTTNGRLVNLSGGLGLGDDITVDCGKGSVYNATTNLNFKLSLDTDFIRLDPGNNTLTLNGALPGNPITIKFTKRYY